MKKLFAILILSLGFIGFTKYIKGKRREYSNLLLEEELPIEEIKKETEIPKEEELQIEDKLPFEEILSNEDKLKLKEPEVNIVKGTIPHHKRKRFKWKDNKIDILDNIKQRLNLSDISVDDLKQLIEFIPVAPSINTEIDEEDDNLIGHPLFDKFKILIQYLNDYDRNDLSEYIETLLDDHYTDDNIDNNEEFED